MSNQNTNQMTVQNAQEVLVQTDFEKKAIEYLDAMGMTKQLDNSQKKLFIELASAYQLNPFKREIYPIVYKNKNGTNDISLVTGYEVYIQRANMSGLLNGWSWETIGNVVFKTEVRPGYNGQSYQKKVIDREKSTLMAKVTIYRKDWDYPFVHTITIDEFCGDSGIWHQSPKFMLKKTCASQAFRLCFSRELCGIPYTADETTTFKNNYEEISVKPAPVQHTEPSKQQTKTYVPNDKPIEPEPIQDSEFIDTSIDDNYTNDYEDEPEEQPDPKKELLDLAEELYDKKFLTDKKLNNIIATVTDPSLKPGLFHYLQNQLHLFKRLSLLSDTGVINEHQRLDLYKGILSAKGTDLPNLAQILDDFEHNQAA